MMKQPNEYWLKYMVLFSEMSLEQIIDSAGLYEFIVPTEGYLSQIRDDLDRTKPAPFRLDRVACKAWARRQRVMSLATEATAAIKARDLLGDTKCRPMLEAFIISDMPMDDVVKYLLKLTGRKVSLKAVKLFAHYFWNRKLLSIDQWHEYLEGHPRKWLLRSCYHRGPDYALWKMGCRVELPQEEVLRAIFHESAMRFLETGQAPNTRDTAMTAKMWAENIFKSVEELNRTGDAVRQVIDELRDFAIRLGRRDISSIDDLDKEADG